MYCYDVCVSVWACVQCSLGCLSQTGWCPLTFVSIIETGCFHQPMTHQVGGGGVQLRSPPSPHLETFKACEPEATHYNLLLYQNQKYHVQQCNNATLCLSKVGAQPPFQFEERRELYLYLCLSVWCCHASS